MKISVKDFEEGKYFISYARQCGNTYRKIALFKAYLKAKEEGLEEFEFPEIKMETYN
jgi:hypothetical protein